MNLEKLKMKDEKYDLNEIVKLRFFYDSCSELEILKNQYTLEKNRYSNFLKDTMTKLSIVIAILAIMTNFFKKETYLRYCFLMFLSMFQIFIAVLFAYFWTREDKKRKLEVSIININHILKHKNNLN